MDSLYLKTLANTQRNKRNFVIGSRCSIKTLLNFNMSPSYFLMGRTFQNLNHLTKGIQFFFARKGDKPKKGSLMLKGGDGVFDSQSSITFTLCEEKVKFPFITFFFFFLLNQPCKVLIQVFIVLKPGIICAFMIHSGSLQKRLTPLFNLVWNTRKSKWKILFE